jgi:hypothetical protein
MTDPKSASPDDLFKIMDAMRSKLLALIDGIPLLTTIHTDNNWRLRDILGHLGAWDEAAIRAVEAYKQGDSYVVSREFTGEDPGEQFNQHEYARYSQLSDDQVVAYFHQARADLKQSIASLTPAQWEGQMHMPWGRGSLNTPFHLGEGMAGHEEEHYELIHQWREGRTTP